MQAAGLAREYLWKLVKDSLDELRFDDCVKFLRN